MPKIWKIAFREYCKPGDVPDGAKAILGARLGGLAADPMAYREVLDMFRALGGAIPSGADLGKKVFQDLVAKRIDEALRRGELVALQRAAPGGVSQSGDGQPAPAQAKKAQKDTPPPETPKQEKTWFRAKLIDELGEPCKNEDYILVDSAGSKRTGKLDANGEVYIPPILPPGECTIQFPNIHLNPRKRAGS